jgi:hypothetical protein
MRGADVMQESLFIMKTLNDFVPADHPLRPIREILNVALQRMDQRFQTMYSAFGRESIAPEKLMRALILQVLYGLRSERLLVEQFGLQPVVSLVRRTRDGGPSLGSLDLFQEPRPVARAGCGEGVVH